ncbi:MAG: hypothetical protein RKO25_07040 [Candidatus Contendobacter sp.]|nr:hypothetical protein [Candidatus Contendobacter sp.]
MVMIPRKAKTVTNGGDSVQVVYRMMILAILANMAEWRNGGIVVSNPIGALRHTFRAGGEH